jgi:hypothetical protein
VRVELEVVVRRNGEVVRDALYHDGPEPNRWSERDAAAVLKGMLAAVDRAAHGAGATRAVTLRGLSWIVSPFDEGVAIAVEIPSGSVVAGPFSIAEDRLSTLITKALAVASG